MAQAVQPAASRVVSALPSIRVTHYTRLVRTILLGLAFLISAVADVTVATDGSGQFSTIQSAVDAAPSDASSRFVIHIKPGVYKGHVLVPPSKRSLSFIGEDATRTVITNDWFATLTGNDGKPIGTFRTASTMIQGDDFTAENITFANSAGNIGQALAISVTGERAIFRSCRFLGWQDTILINAGRQYFENCYIEGAVDFIFGASTAWFERCEIHIRGNGYITAASTPQDHPFGYVFSHCRITAESPGLETYLGRPWRDFAAVIFMNTDMSDVVRPLGWNNWNMPDRERTSRYAEYQSTGPGANSDARVAWAHTLTDEEAAKITIANVFGGWDPVK